MSKQPSEWGDLDLKALIGLQENTGLEFKRFDALRTSDGSKSEIAKDVSAMANAAGGVIVYGLVEDGDGNATSFEDVPAPQAPEWLEQVIITGIEPRISGLRVHQISREGGSPVIVVEVPQATVHAPHQVRATQKYYRRHDRTILAMLDHEVRDLMFRARQPDLFLEFDFVRQSDGRIAIQVTYGNRANEPALYSTVDLYFDPQLNISKENKLFDHLGSVRFGNSSQEYNRYTANFMVPNSLPVFKERPLIVFNHFATINPNTVYGIAYRICAPGFTVSRRGQLFAFGKDFHIELADASF